MGSLFVVLLSIKLEVSSFVTCHSYIHVVRRLFVTKTKHDLRLPIVAVSSLCVLPDDHRSDALNLWFPVGVCKTTTCSSSDVLLYSDQAPRTLQLHSVPCLVLWLSVPCLLSPVLVDAQAVCLLPLRVLSLVPFFL